jgi:hypothetical protein
MKRFAETHDSGAHVGVAERRTRDMHDLEAESEKRRDGFIARVEPRGGGKRDIIDKIPASIVVVADEGGSGGNAFHRPDQSGVDAIVSEPLNHDRAKSVIADRANENTVPSRARRLIDENSRSARGKRPGINARASMAAVLARTYEFHEKLADTANFRPTRHAPPALESFRDSPGKHVSCQNNYCRSSIFIDAA